MAAESSSNGSNVAIVKRDEGGRFISGTAGGPGNPLVRQVASWRNALAECVSPADLCDVIDMLLHAARRGEPWAVKEVLDRCLGKPKPTEQAREERPFDFWKYMIDHPPPPELLEAD
jgi:hypothetical protein